MPNIRNFLSCVPLCLVALSPPAAQEIDVPALTEEHGGFALPDEYGSRLIIVHDVPRPEALATALCSGGIRYPARFTSRQRASTASTGRQVPSQFDHLAGTLFTVSTGRVGKDATCFLATESLLRDTVMLKPRTPSGPGACVQRRRFAAERKRAVVRCWPLAELGGGRHVALLQFEPRGQQALASLVLLDGDASIFSDHQAKLGPEDGDVWRVDDEGRLSPSAFDVLWVLKRGDRYALALSWEGTEGSALSLSISDGSNRFTQVLSEYWYHSPL